MGDELTLEPREAARYIDVLNLPERDSELEALEREDLPEPEYVSEEPQLLTVGAQLLEFDAAFPAEMRPHVTNGMLIAQLAADRASKDDPGGGFQLWYDTYLDTLKHVGWTVEARSTEQKQFDAGAGEVHQELIPLVVAALGSAAAGALVVKLLQGLSTMAANEPWITLFNHKSQKASASQFQVGYVASGSTDAGAGTPSISLLSFEVEANRRVMQVLLFKLGGVNASLRHHKTTLRLNEPVFQATKEAVQARITPFVTTHIADLKI